VHADYRPGGRRLGADRGATGHMILMLGDPRYFGRFGFVAAIPMAIHGPHDDARPAFQALVLPG